MAKIHKTIEVNVPVSTAYNQWTQFEEFPAFMEGVEEVRQLDDSHLQWVASVGAKRNEWKAEITEQKPDQRVAWRSTEGKDNTGVVTFESLGAESTRVIVEMEFAAEGLAEKVDTLIGSDDRRVEGDLGRFKEMIESRTQEPGEWRGKITDGAVRR